MAEFRCQAVAELAGQMRFTPHDRRLEQLAAAEQLLHQLDPSRRYPLDFVTDRITGYRPKSPAIELISGRDLQHDTGLLIETVSQTLTASPADAAEPVLSIDELASRLNIATKTVQRWRRRGLAGRYFVYPDGRKRIGFFLSSVERFMRVHEAELAPPSSAAPPGQTDQTESMLRSAERLARQGCWVEEIARRLAGRFGCSSLAVLSRLEQHQVKLNAPAAPTEAVRHRVLRALRHGDRPALIAAQNGLSRYAIYRVWMDHRLARLTAANARFIDDPLYHQPDASQALQAIVSQDSLPSPSDPEQQRIPRDLPPYLQALYRTPLFSPQQERAAFLQYNYDRFRFAAARRQLDPLRARRRDMQRLERLAEQAAASRNRIIAANLRLVVSVARKHLRPPLALMDLVSEGNLTLIRAIDGFDVHRGYRFSTYATFALMRGFARQIPQMLWHLRAPRLDAQTEGLQLPDQRVGRDSDLREARERVANLLKHLAPRERDVLAGYFGLGGRRAAQTYQQIGRQMGISRQRVREIERAALAKLRSAGAGAGN